MSSRTLTKQEADLVAAIAGRYWERCIDNGQTPMASRITVAMDIEAAMLGGCDLALAELLDAPIHEFMHDIRGILLALDRSTGKLAVFWPRYARQVVISDK